MMSLIVKVGSNLICIYALTKGHLISECILTLVLLTIKSGPLEQKIGISCLLERAGNSEEELCTFVVNWTTVKLTSEIK